MRGEVRVVVVVGVGSESGLSESSRQRVLKYTVLDEHRKKIPHCDKNARVASQPLPVRGRP